MLALSTAGDLIIPSQCLSSSNECGSVRQTCSLTAANGGGVKRNNLDSLREEGTTEGGDEKWAGNSLLLLGHEKCLAMFFAWARERREKKKLLSNTEHVSQVVRSHYFAIGENRENRGKDHGRYFEVCFLSRAQRKTRVNGKGTARKQSILMVSLDRATSFLVGGIMSAFAG